MKYDESLKNKPFKSYNEYMQYIFDCVNTSIDRYLDKMKAVYANDEGGYKNVLYPDLELAGDMTRNHVERFYTEGEADTDSEDDGTDDGEDEDED
ncbi:MAG: hypothetical protein K6G42_02525, partial [Lachnospiraceae bacterium]|nr:hypothetical protein [Lachnospiraceae bacterium]